DVDVLAGLRMNADRIFRLHFRAVDEAGAGTAREVDTRQELAALAELDDHRLSADRAGEFGGSVSEIGLLLYISLAGHFLGERTVEVLQGLLIGALAFGDLIELI